MSERHFNAGTKMFFGAPANPIPEAMSDAIGQIVARVPGVCEAYLPQCYIEGEQEARQILVVGVEKGESIPQIVQELMGKLKLLLPPDVFIDILPFESASVPPEARVETCHIFGSPKKPWWKLWRGRRTVRSTEQP